MRCAVLCRSNCSPNPKYSCELIFRLDASQWGTTTLPIVTLNTPPTPSLKHYYIHTSCYDN